MSARKSPVQRAVPQRIYQLHVSLIDIQPSVWRRLWVADTLTLAKLDRVIQAAMGWTNSHLHEFVIGARRYGIPDEEWPQDVPTLDERRFDVGTVLAGDVREFTYTYDFGDGWQHAVKVEQAMFPNDLNIRPICLAGQNACPPEDVGGAGGYVKFLNAIQDPSHEEHAAMWQWCGGPFDPTGFDVNAANLAIRHLRIRSAAR